MEVLARLVVAAVFKTVGPYVKHAVGGFDSHALPPYFHRTPERKVETMPGQLGKTSAFTSRTKVNLLKMLTS